MREKSTPHHDTEDVKRRVHIGRIATTRRVDSHLHKQGWSRTVVRECFAALSPADFHKSQQHRERSGQWLDIYRPRLAGELLYVKFTVDADGYVLLLSFCRDGEDH